LLYTVFRTPELLSVSAQLRGSIEIRYEGRSVTDLEGVTVIIRNVGNRSIQVPKDSEYETPVELDFGDRAEIIGSPRITEKVPETLKASVVVSDGKVVLEPVLLNPGNSLTVFTLLSDFRGEPKINAHIKDVELKEAERPPLVIAR
jgi:hypothetical protein